MTCAASDSTASSNGSRAATATPSHPRAPASAVFYTKVHTRVLRPLVAAADQPPAPIELRRALTTIDRTIDTYVENARLATAA